VIVFVLLQSVQPLLALMLAGMVYLAVIEVRPRQDMTLQSKVWWVMLVLLFNVVGLIALRIYTFVLDRRARA